MEKLRAGIDFILSSYKRTAAILFIAALTLAIPITITLVNQTQDIRQRASDGDNDEFDLSLIRCNESRSCPEGYTCLDSRGRILRGDDSGRCFRNPTATPTSVPIVCTQDVQICPDGTSVGRTGPNCTFPACPDSPTPTSTPSATPTISTTPTPTTGHESSNTKISLSLSLTGIGSGSARIGLNPNPKRPQRNVDLLVLNSQNQEVKSAQGSVIFDKEASGFYKGTLPLGNLESGAYIVKVRLNNTLWKSLPGIQNITKGTTYDAPHTTLVSGDFNHDNEINLLDYTLMISCLQNRSACNNSFSMEDVKEFIAFMNAARLRGEI